MAGGVGQGGAARGFDPAAPLDPARALTPHAVKLNARLVQRRLLPKLRRVLRHVPFADDVLALFYCALDPQTPARTKGLVFAGLAYFVLPFDVVPDWIPVLGFTDDAAVLAATLALAGRAVQDRHREAARRKLDELAGADPDAATAG